jgi:hypothetical protein
MFSGIPYSPISVNSDLLCSALSTSLTGISGLQLSRTLRNSNLIATSPRFASVLSKTRDVMVERREKTEANPNRLHSTQLPGTEFQSTFKPPRNSFISSFEAETGFLDAPHNRAETMRSTQT